MCDVSSDRDEVAGDVAQHSAFVDGTASRGGNLTSATVSALRHPPIVKFV